MNPFTLRDSRFDPTAARISSYFGQLFIKAGSDHIQYAILDTDRNCFIALAEYQSEYHLKDAEWTGALTELFHFSEHLGKKYPLVGIGIESPYHVIVPAPLYDPDQKEKQLGINFELPEGLEYFADFLPEVNAWNVAGLPGNLISALKQQHPGSILVHSATPLVKNLSLVSRVMPGPSKMFLNFRNDNFDVALFSDGSLLFFNTFHFEAPEDVLYFTLYSAEQLKIRTNDILLRLSGDQPINEEISRLLEEFIPNTGFAGRPGEFTYSPMLDLPAYRYLSLFSLALCGS